MIINGGAILKAVGQERNQAIAVLLRSHDQDMCARLLALKPARIIFNPGAENPSLAKDAKALGIEVLEACTLVMLGTGQY